MKTNDIISSVINKHLITVRYIVVFLMIVFTTTLFPRHNFTYDYELNQPWKYDDLLAPFKFSIKKSQIEYQGEIDRQLKDFYPYYEEREEVKIKVQQSFVQEFRRVFPFWKQDTLKHINPEDSTFYLQMGFSLLDTIYRRGVIRISPEQNLSPPTEYMTQINVIKKGDNKQRTRDIHDFFSTTSSGESNLTVSAFQFVNSYLTGIDLPEKRLAGSFITLVTQVLEPNIIYNANQTKELRDQRINAVSLTKGVVETGELIVSQGLIVNQNIYQKLESLKDAYTTQSVSNNNTSLFNKYFSDYMDDIGYFLITLIVILIFATFLYVFEKDTFLNLRELSFIFISIFTFLHLVSWVVRYQQQGAFVSLYIVPFCIIPIIIRNFFGTWMAHYVHIIIVLLTGFIVPLGYEYLFLHFVAGFVAIMTNEKTYYWSDFFVSTALILLTYIVGYLGIAFIQADGFESLKLANLGWLVGNAFLTLLAYPLIPVFERLFGFVSDISLVELGDMNKPLLKKLNQEAPGSFWHSIQVSNLAEAAAAAIGANPLLAKVGALYHDIGKMHRPAYFIENQKSTINPHDDLPYLESTKIIRQHVTKGIEMAKKEALPNIIIDFIRTHHGTTRIEYFYQKYVKENPDIEVDDKLFRYPGPTPYSKETAVVMIADSIEAASRSLKNPTEEDINRLVDKIVDHKTQQNQFVNCDISFKDISTIKKVFKKQLRSIYHIRVSYPVEATKK